MGKPLSQWILELVNGHPEDLVTAVAVESGKSRPAVHAQLKKLIQSGRIENRGRSTRPYYVLSSSSKRSASLFFGESSSWRFEIAEHPEEGEVWESFLAPNLAHLRPEVRQICQYGFTEMYNNVVDHSGSKTAAVTLSVGHQVDITIVDEGIGVFRKILEAFSLSDYREAVLQLSKGKLTTDPRRHSGEGLFFTARAFDTFMLRSNGIAFGRVNNRNDEDWLLGEGSEEEEGTGVVLSIESSSSRRLEDVFARFTDAPGNLSFSNTAVLVVLARHKDEFFVSRSQAKRVLLNLEKFKHVTLDFKDVESVGQGFVDEVFRVFKNAHPGIVIDYINANPSVEFMIKRGLA